MKSVDELLDLWEEQRENGRELTPEELCADSPDLLTTIRREIAAIKGFERHFGSSSEHHFEGSSRTTTTAQPSDNDRAQPGVDSPPRTPLKTKERPTEPFLQPSLASGTDLTVNGRYRVLRLHGTGGLGEVYEALDLVLNRKVAIKIPRKNCLSREHLHRFEREALITGGLDHPGIIPVHSFYAADKARPFYVMRFAEGVTLQQKVRQFHEHSADPASAENRKTQLRALIQAVRGVCGIISYAHLRGVIHRDIKPANILVGQFGETILLDWGLARNLSELPSPDEYPGDEHQESASHDNNTELPPVGVAPAGVAPTGFTAPGRFIGTPGYASPEQNLGQVHLIDYRSDVYSIGATLYYVLLGKSPGRTYGLDLSPNQPAAHPDTSLALARKADPGLVAIIEKAMAPKADQRYASVAELDRDLDRWLSGESLSVYRGSVSARLARQLAKHPKMATVIGTSIVLLFVFVEAANVLLQGKNTELAASNEKLQTAIARAESASKNARGTLQLLIDDVVANDLLSKEELTDSERAFFQTILQRFQELADVQEDSIESRRISAEGSYASGRLLVRLSQSRDALPYLKRAAETLESLANETGDHAFQLQLAGVCELWGNTLIEQGELKAADDVIGKGIRILTPAVPSEAKVDATLRTAEYRLMLANFYSIAGYLRTLEKRMEDAIQNFTSAEEILTELLKEDSTNQRWKLALGRVFRSLGDACGEIKDYDRQQQYALRSIELHRTLVDANNNIPDYRLGLIWSLYDSAGCHVLQGRHAEAIQETSEAIEWCEQLKQQFPLDYAYNGPQAILRSRRARSLEVLGKDSEAETDYLAAEEALRLVLTRNTRSAEVYPQLLTCLRRLSALQRKLEKHELADQTDRRFTETAEQFKADFPEFSNRATELRQ